MIYLKMAYNKHYINQQIVYRNVHVFHINI